MSNRIMAREVKTFGGFNTVYDVYSADFREVIDTKPSFNEAMDVLKAEANQARECPSCEE